MSATPSPGVVRSLWGLTRPRGAGWVAALPLLGFAWGHWDRGLMLRSGPGVLGLMVAWAALNAGTMWLNAALDRDDGEVLYGASWPVPRHVIPAAWTALAAGVALAATIHPVAGACALGCAVLAVLYSSPRHPWKGHPVLGPAVNVVGYGVLSPVAGWWLVGWPTDARTLLTWALLWVWILGCYFAAQAFQEEEDRARGYRTLVAVAGPTIARRAALGAIAFAGGGFLGLAAAGWYPRLVLAGLPVLSWAFVALREAPETPGWSSRVFGRLLWFGWVVLLAVFLQYLTDSVHGDRPVAGLGTVRGLPPDRPALSPAVLYRIEHWAVDPPPSTGVSASR